MNSYYHRIKELLPGISESDLERPVQEGNIDSIDLVCIRALLEKRVGELPDGVWNRFNTIQEAMAYCQEMEAEGGCREEAVKSPWLTRGCAINMPQMACGGLSEHWLFKELGDLHWALLAAGLHVASAALKAETGARLYATFVRIQMVHDPLHAFRENETLELEGSVRRFGGSTYISRVEGSCGGKALAATLMTTFSARVEGNNTALLKGVPQVPQNDIPECVLTPPFLSDYRLLRKGLLEDVVMDGLCFRVVDDVLFETAYDIHPYYEINGVGLLYFAAYPVISDVCEARYFNGAGIEGARWEDRYSTVARDVFYFANCNSDEQVVYRLNSYALIGGGRMRVCSSLWRKSDGALMARLFTVKAARL